MKMTSRLEPRGRIGPTVLNLKAEFFLGLLSARLSTVENPSTSVEMLLFA